MSATSFGKFVLSAALLIIVVNGPETRAQDSHSQTSSSQDVRKKVAILLFRGVELLDFAGPGEVFASARDKDGKNLFDVFTVGISDALVVSQQFLTIKPAHTLENCPRPDVVVIPGGDVTPVMRSKTAQEWIGKVSAEGALLFTVCNGATVLSKSGMLDHRVATTHHGAVDLLKWLSPKTTVYADRRVIDTNNIITSAGVSAGIDGALYLVARLAGIEVARDTAVFMEYDGWRLLEPELVRLQNNRDPIKSITGRVFVDRNEASVYRLLRTLFDNGMEAALALYPPMYAKATGHDREMIAQEGLTEIAEFLLANGRDPSVGVKLLEFVAKTHPKSAKAWEKLAVAQEKYGQAAAARASFAQCLQLDPQNMLAKEGLNRLRQQ